MDEDTELIEEFRVTVFDNMDWIDPGGSCDFIDLAYGYFLGKVDNFTHALSLAKSAAHLSSGW